MGLAVTGLKLENGFISFNWNFVGFPYIARRNDIFGLDFFIDDKIVGGNTIILNGSGSESFAFTGDQANLKFLSFYYVDVKSPSGYYIAQQTTLETFYRTVSKVISLANTVQISITNASYTQASNGERNFKFILNYSILNSNVSLYGLPVDLYVQFKDQLNRVTLLQKLTRNLASSLNGTFSIGYFDNPDYQSFPDNTMKVECFMWERNTSIPISNTIGNQSTIVITNPVITTLRYRITFSNGSYIIQDLSLEAKNYYVNLGNVATLEPNGIIGSYPAPIVPVIPTTQRYRITFPNGSYIIQDLTIEAKNYYVNLGNVAILDPNGIIGSYPAPVIPVTKLRYRITFSNGSYIIQDLDQTAVNYYINLGNVAILDPNGIVGSYPAPIIPVTTLRYRITFPNGSYLIEDLTLEAVNYYTNLGNIATLEPNGIIGSYPAPIIPVLIPNAPILEVINSYAQNQKLVKWNKVTGLTMYNLEISTPGYPSFNSLTQDFTVGINNDLITQWGIDVAKGQDNGIYSFRIRAKNSAGYSPYSNIANYPITGGTNPVITNRSLLSMIPKLFTMATFLSLLGSANK